MNAPRFWFLSSLLLALALGLAGCSGYGNGKPDAGNDGGTDGNVMEEADAANDGGMDGSVLEEADAGNDGGTDGGVNGDAGDDGGAGGDGACTAPTPKQCSDKRCHECCVASDCAPTSGCTQSMMDCDANYTCQCICAQAGSDCSKDPNSCCTGLTCGRVGTFLNKCGTACTAASDCTGAGVDFASDLQCTGGVCDFQHCTSDRNCRAGTVCYNGDCVTPATCSQVKSCTVVPATAVTQQGLMVGFAATAFLQSGALAPGVNFTWSSSDPGTAAVDASGVVTGGASSGTATVTATVAGCSTTCTATVTNYGAEANNRTRVIVIDELTGMPVQGAHVTVGPVGPIATDASGVADLAIVTNASTPNDISVYKTDYNYVTFAGVQANNVIIHAKKIFPSDQCGGFRGDFSFDQISCGPGHPCEVKLAFAGPSIPGSLTNLTFKVLLGELIKTHIELGGTKNDFGLPAGGVVGLNTTWFKQHFTPSGVPGRRVAWGMGGKIDLSVLIDKLGPIISGGTSNVDLGEVLVLMVPLFSGFYTSLRPNMDVALIPKVIDWNDLNSNDVDASGNCQHCVCSSDCPNGDYCDPIQIACAAVPSGVTPVFCKSATGAATACPDIVCDFDNFPTLLGGGMTLDVKMEQTMTFTVPDLTKACKDSTGQGVYCYDGVVILPGVIVMDAGFVPLGLAIGPDKKSKDDVADGKIEPITVPISDVAGRIPESQVKRVVLAVALTLEDLSSSSGSTPHAGQVKFIDSFTGNVTLDAFMNPSVATFDAATRKLTFSGVSADADCLQAIFSDGSGNNWHMLADKTATELDLPAAPAEGDRAAKVKFVTINLRSDTAFQDLPKFGSGKNLGNLVELVQAFSSVEAVKQ